MKRLPLVVAVASVLSVACRDRELPLAPASGRPAFLISDGAHTGGNADFFFLPPLVPDPSGSPNFDGGKFNAQLAPIVEVCELGADPRLVPTTDCVAGDPVLGPATLPLDGEQYHRNWDTKASRLRDDKFYRMIVRGAPRGTPLGFLDLDPVSGGMKNVRTGDVVAFQDGRTLPINVRIEDGAFGSTSRSDHVERVVPNVATVVTTNTGFAGASFPDNWLPANAVSAGITQVVVIVERLAVNDGTTETSCLQSGLLEHEGCYRFRTDPDLHAFGDFSQPVTAGVCFDLPALVGQAAGPPFQLYRRAEVEGAPTGPAVPLDETVAPFLNCAAFGPTPVIGAIRAGGLRGLASAGWRALVAGLGRFISPGALHAVDLGAGGRTNAFSRIGWARTATLTKVASTDNQMGLINTKLPIDPQVCLTFSHHSDPRPLVDEPVRFTVAAGGGTVGGGPSTVVRTGSTGCASAPWVLGSTTVAAGNRLTATAAASPGTVEFMAAGVSLTGVSAQVEAGGFHSCALTAAGQAFCWGNNRGQLGDGTAPDRYVPTAVAGGLTFAALSAGDGATCGLTPTGAAYCWGFNSGGQLGDGTTTDRFSPTPVAGGVTFAALSAGNNGAGGHTCGVTTSGAAYCWGHNGNGQLGDGTTTDRLVPTPVAGGVTFAALSAGGQHTCGVTPSGAAYCWGFNGAGGLGDGTTTQRLVPTLVAGGVTFAALSAGEAHTCGVTQTSAAYCWGFNASGELGDGTTTSRLVPTPVGAGLSFVALSAGFGYTCGVTTTGTPLCWGFNGRGELGDGTTTERHIPTLVAGGLSFAAASAGTGHTCGVTTSGVVYCWGLNGNGQVGDGTTTNRLVPTAVAFATGPIPDISGTYAGTVSGANTDGSGVFSGPAAFQFVQTGAAITGTWSSSAGNDPATGTVNGTINGSVVTITFTETAPCPDSFTGSGTITNGGASISGSFSRGPGPACGPKPFSGTLQVSRIVPGGSGVSGLYTGAVTFTGSFGSGGEPLTFQLTETGTGFTGTFSSPDPLSGQVTVGAINAIGGASGFTFALVVTAPCPGNFTGLGTIANAGASLFASLSGGPDCGGGPLSGMFLVSRSALSSEFTVAADADGQSVSFDGTNYLVGIQDQLARNQPRPGVFAQFVSSSGALQGPRVGPLGPSGNIQGDPPCVSFGASNYLVAWAGNFSETGGDILGQLVTTGGALAGVGLAITSTHDASSSGGVVYGGGRYFVAYERTSGSLHKIYGRLVSPDGTVGSELAISSGFGQVHFDLCHQVAFDGANFLVVWIEESSDPSLNNMSVKGRFVNPSGALGAEFTVNGGGPTRSAAEVAYNGSTYFVIWNTMIDPTDEDVLGQQVTTAGSLSGSVITIATGSGFQFGHVSAGGGNFLVVWDDLRSNPPSFAIKGKVFNGSGTLIGAERTLFTQGSDGRAPGVRGEVFNGREYFLVLSRATPPLNPFDFNAYTNQSLAGAFMTP